MVVSSVTHPRAMRASRAANPLTQVNLNHSQTAPARENRCCSTTTIPSVPVETSCIGSCRVLRARDGHGWQCVVCDWLLKEPDRCPVTAVLRSMAAIGGRSLCRGRCWIIACTYFTELQCYDRFNSSVLSCSENRICFSSLLRTFAILALLTATLLPLRNTPSLCRLVGWTSMTHQI